MNALPNLVIYKFLINLQLLEDALLPEFKGSTFRGAMGWHLKKAVDNLNPIYEFIFETEGDENNPDVLKGVKRIPHPFVQHPPLSNKRFYQSGEIITIGLTLIGYAHNFLPFFIQAYAAMGKSGLTSKKHKFKLQNVVSEDYLGSKYLIYENGSSKIKKNYKAITNKEILQNINFNTNKVKLHFETPVLVQDKDGEITESEKHKITPQFITASIERRYKNLAHLFCRSTVNQKKIFIPDRSVKIAKMNLTDYEMISFSNRLNKTQKFGGLLGNIVIEGDLKSILPILYIGEKIHIGKKTSYGWGQYKLTVIE